MANDLAHFPRAVGFAVVHIPGKLDVGSESGIGAGAAGNCDVSSGDEHAWADDVAAIDGIAQGNVAERAIGAYVAHRGESRFQRDSGVGHGLERDSCGGFLNWLTDRCVGSIGKMGVTVDEAGQHGHFGEIDDFCIGRNCEIATYRLDFVVADQDGLILENGGGIWVDQLTGADGGGLSGCGTH